MEDSKESLVDRIVKATTKPLIISGVSLIFIGSAVAIKEGNRDSYIQAGKIFGSLALLYGPFAIYERCLERRNKFYEEKQEQIQYKEMTA